MEPDLIPPTCLAVRPDDAGKMFERCSNMHAHIQKKLSVVGKSLGLIIDKPVLELLRIDKETTLDVTSDGVSLLIRPLRGERSDHVRAASERVADKHAKAFEKLAK
jgi:hypothetical protein